MTEPWEAIEQGRGWLQEGEGPLAIIEEATQLAKETGDLKCKAAWKLVAAEAYLANCAPRDALPLLSEILPIFKEAREHKCELAVLGALIEAHLAEQDWQAAAVSATRAAELARQAKDARREVSMLLKLAEIYLRQMRDPYQAVQAALAARQRSSEVGDAAGKAQALQLAAEAQMLYAPEQALKAATEAVAAWEQVGDHHARAASDQLVTAAKSQVATIQHAVQATSMSCRGDAYTAHKWPQYAQQQGERAMDPFAFETYVPHELPKPHNSEPKTTFMRREFKWNNAADQTDEAWFRQELRYLPPPTA